MLSLIFSHSPSFLFSNPTATGRSFATAPLSFSVVPSRNPRRIKSTIVHLSSNKPPITPGGNDDGDTADPEPPTVTDEWGEKSVPESEPFTKLSSLDPPKDEDEWGTDDTEQSNRFSVTGNGSAVAEAEDNSKIEALKRCLADSVYGTGLGFSASAEERAEVIELVTQLEGANPTPAPTDAVQLLDGKWILL